MIKVKDYDDVVYEYGYDGLGHRISQGVKKDNKIYVSETTKSDIAINNLIDRIKLVKTKEYGSLCLVSFYYKETVDKLPNKTVFKKAKEQKEEKTFFTILSNKNKEIEIKNETKIKYINDYTYEYEKVLVQIQDNVSKNYLYGNSLISDNSINYIIDRQENVILTTSTNGVLKEEYSYSDYGLRDKKYDPFIKNNEIGYNSEFHTGTNEIYLRARYYDPSTRNFISEDTYRGTLYDPSSRNRYSYARNNPKKYKDPSGHRYEIGTGNGFGLRRSVQVQTKHKVVQSKVVSQRQSNISHSRAPPRINPISKGINVSLNKPASYKAIRQENIQTATQVINQRNQVATSVRKTVEQSIKSPLTNRAKAIVSKGNITKKLETLNKAYEPVKGSLENKVKGICEKGTDLFKGLFEKGKEIVQKIDWQEVAIATTSATVAALAGWATGANPIVIGAVYGAMDGLLHGLAQNKSAGSIVVDTLIGGTIGAATSYGLGVLGKLATGAASKLALTGVGKTIASVSIAQLLN